MQKSQKKPQVKTIGDSPATKRDLQIVKKDLQVVKNDLQNDIQVVKNDLQVVKNDLHDEIQVVKKDLQGEIQAVKKDLQVVKKDLHEEMLSIEGRLRLEIKMTAKDTKDEIREEMKLMKSEIIDHLDAFLGEIKSSREERDVVAYQLSSTSDKVVNHEIRIKALENKVSTSSS